MAHKVN
ncbi:hypothetical protein F383_14318 [Gossypium arboreum]|nr:hypothetical protein F383_14317 [Gossypium arboreum]KHG10995.1 hypothetical protein F383_14318 [Gossypium arboreum]